MRLLAHLAASRARIPGGSSVARTGILVALGFVAGLAGEVQAQSRKAFATPCTRVQGAVSGTWTRSGSPYCVSGDLVVARADALVLEPGVRVVVAPGAEIRIQGTLVAHGTAEQPIVFRPAAPSQPWRGLVFDSGLPGSSLRHCPHRPS